ncbi:MAG: hypothetical protein QUS33_07935 [Dehalococcoidia bacterium]|nr:hypothetical protein [Dehalococcoidia bacterium]
MARSAPPVIRQPLMANPHLGKDLRRIGIVAAVLMALLIIISRVL